MKLKLVKAKTLKQLLEIFRKGEPVPVEVLGYGGDNSLPAKPDKWAVKITSIESNTHDMHFIIRGVVKISNSPDMPVAWKYKLQLPSQKHTGVIFAGKDAEHYKGDDDATLIP